MRDPEAEPQQEEGTAMSPASSESVSKGEGAGTSTPSRNEIAEWKREKRSFLLLQIQEPLWKEPTLPERQNKGGRYGNGTFPK
jgi:hypothetical protein